MTQHTAAHTAGGVEDAVSARLAAGALWVLQGPGALDVRTGVIRAPGNPMAVTGTASTSPWTVTVNAGHVIGSKGSANGPYYAANDGLYTLTMTVPPASNSRIDVIYAMQMDSAALLNADGSTAAVIAAAGGTPSATPAAPAIPSGAVALAQVLIASTAVAGTSGAGVTITDVRQFTTTRGAAVPVTNATDLATLTPVDGDTAYQLDTHKPLTYKSTGWVADPVVVQTDNTGATPPAGAAPLIQAFVVAATTSGAGVVTVTFPQAFTNPPIVTATSTQGTSVAPVISANVITTTGCQFVWPGVYSTAIRFDVIAIGW